MTNELPAWASQKAAMDACADGSVPYQPGDPRAAANWPEFKAWALHNLGQGYSLAVSDGIICDPTTAWCFTGYQAGARTAIAVAVAAEREAAAKLCDEYGQTIGAPGEWLGGCISCAAAIRARATPAADPIAPPTGNPPTDPGPR